MRTKRYYLIRGVVRAGFRLAVLLLALLAINLMFATVWDSLFWASIIAVVLIVLNHRNKQAAVRTSSGHSLQELVLGQ